MKNLIEFLSTHSVNYAFTSGILLTVLIVAIACIIILYLRLKEAKISLKKELFFNKVSAETIEGYESQIKLQECQIEEKKKAFEDAVAEITELRSKEGVLKCKVKVLTEQIDYWKERALHQKHTKKVVESEWYECINDIFPNFIKGKKYQDSKRKTLDNLVWLIHDKHCYLVNKNDFKPVQQ